MALRQQNISTLQRMEHNLLCGFVCNGPGRAIIASAKRLHIATNGTRFIAMEHPAVLPICCRRIFRRLLYGIIPQISCQHTFFRLLMVFFTPEISMLRSQPQLFCFTSFLRCRDIIISYFDHQFNCNLPK